MHKHTPIAVGIGSIQQRITPPHHHALEVSQEPLELMANALGVAGQDSTAEILPRATSIRAPRGFWNYPDPCRLIADAIGAPAARTEVAEIGVLQTTMFGRAAADIASGKDEIVLLVGGEARNRTRLCGKLGIEEELTQQDESVVPNHVLRPAQDVLSDIEIERGLAWPVHQYSMIENALRAADGISIDEHRDQVASLWAQFNATAVENPHAWNREPADMATIRGDSGERMLAFPYTKLHTSQWNVDQAAGLIMTSVEVARELGIPESKWIYPHAVVDSNLMLPLTERRDPHRCAGFAMAADRIRERTGRAVSDADFLELYSCFPSAVRLQMREMQIPVDRQVTVTGGMAYAGGPLNNFAFQGLCRLVEILREHPGSSGAVTAVSGMLTKQGVSVWSTQPPESPFFFDDVSEETEAASPSVDVVEHAEGEARVVTYSVLNPAVEPQVVALVELGDGTRTVVITPDPDLAQLGMREDLIGRTVKIRTPDQLQLA